MDNPLQKPELLRSENISLDETNDHDWSHDIELQLENIEKNSAIQANICKKHYLYLVYISRFFKIPNIILSSCISVFSIGLNNFISQEAVSILNCILGFIVATIGSIELYLMITKKMDIALTSYQNYYLLSVKISNCLRLNREHRPELNGRSYLASCLAEYEQIFQTSNITADEYHDRLINIELKIKK